MLIDVASPTCRGSISSASTPASSWSHHYVVVEVDEAGAGLSRDALQLLLEAENVLARRYFYPGSHRLEPYRSMFPDVAARLPVTEGIAARALCLPTGQSIDEATIVRLCTLIRFAVEHSDGINERRAGKEHGAQ